MKSAVKREVYILSLSNFFSDLGSGMLIALIPLYIIDLEAPFLNLPLMVKAGIAASIFGMAMAVFQPFVGRLSDKLDRRKPFILIGVPDVFRSFFILCSRFQL